MASTPILNRGFNEQDGREENIQSSYNMQKTITAVHARVHAKLAYNHSGLNTVPAGGYLRYLLRIGGTVFHLRDFAFKTTEGPAGVFLYEAPFVDTNSLGTQLVSRNLNRSVAVDSYDFALYRDPFTNAASAGTELDYDLQPATSGGAIRAAGGSAGGPAIEWVLRQDTDYLIEFVNSSTNAAIVGDRVVGYAEG